MTYIEGRLELEINPNLTHFVGCHGMGLFGKKNPKWYPCVVTEDNQDGTIKVRWVDDGRFTKQFPVEKFRPDTQVGAMIERITNKKRKGYSVKEGISSPTEDGSRLTFEFVGESVFFEMFHNRSSKAAREHELMVEISRSPVEGLALCSDRWELSATAVVAVLEGSRSTLRKLKLHCVRFGGRVSELLAASIESHPFLEEIDFKGLDVNEGGHVDWYRFIVALATCPRLKCVTIEFSDSMGNQKCDEGHSIGDAFARLCASPCLETLILVNCPFVQTEPLVAVFKTLEASTTLKHLTIQSDWRIKKPQLINCLATMLKKSKSIETLSIPLRIGSATPVALALYTNRTLKRLELREGGYDCANSRFYSGAANALANNSVLTHLIVSGKDVLTISDQLCKNYDFEHNGGAVYRKLLLYLRMNQAGRADLLLERKSEREVVETIAAHAEDTDMTFCFLKMNQSFFKAKIKAKP